MSVNDHENSHLDIFIESLNSIFRPATSHKEATHSFTTHEIFEEIKKIDPGLKITLPEIHDAMVNAGYRYQPKPGSVGFNLRWILIEKLL